MFDCTLAKILGRSSSQSKKPSRHGHSRRTERIAARDYSDAHARGGARAEDNEEQEGRHSRSGYGERGYRRHSGAGERSREASGGSSREIAYSNGAYKTDSEASWERFDTRPRHSPRVTARHGRGDGGRVDMEDKLHQNTREAVDEQRERYPRPSSRYHTREGRDGPTTEYQDEVVSTGYESDSPQTIMRGASPKPLRRSQTDPTTLDPRKTERTRQRHRSTGRSSQEPSPRIFELPDIGYVDIMAENTWFGGKIDRELAEGIAFSDLGHVEQLSRLSNQQRQGITRSYFQTLDDYDQRLKAATAQSRREFEQIFDGMARASQRVLLYAAVSGIRPVEEMATYRPDQDELYIAHEASLNSAFEDAQREFKIRSGPKQRAWSAMRGGGLEDAECREEGPVGILRKRYGSFPTQQSEPRRITRTTYRYSDGTR